MISELRVWVVKWAMDVGEVWAFKAYRDVGYWGAVSIFDADGDPMKRFVKVVFKWDDEEEAKEVANKLLNVLKKPSLGSMNPRKILKILAALYTRYRDDPLAVTVVESAMDIHNNGETALLTHKALLS